ncbi:hypothetical protein Tco_0775791 [Tanacetum coccineum]
MPVRRIELSEYAVLLGKQIRRLDCETQYAVLIRRFDTSYPTGGYGVSVSEKDSIRRIQQGRYGVLGWIPWSARYSEYAVLGIGQTRFLVKSWRRYTVSL